MAPHSEIHGVQYVRAYAFAIAACDAIGQRPHKQALLERLEGALYGMAVLVRCTMKFAGGEATSISRRACWRSVLSSFARRFTLR